MRLPQYYSLCSGDTFLFAASPYGIDSFSCKDGSYLSSWTCPRIDEDSKVDIEMTDEVKLKITDSSPSHQDHVSALDQREDLSPMAKRRRLSDVEIKLTKHTEDGGDSSKEVDSRKGRKQKSSDAFVTAMVLTNNADHLVAVTGEDKTLRVLKHDGLGHLTSLSERIMPKRPCAIALTADQSTVICADKFGDVYSLPLLFDPQSKVIRPESPVGQKDESEQAFFVPAANKHTVHSMRNRKTLQSQLRQPTMKKAVDKEEQNFQHDLLLGHVSLLTCLELVKLERRNYIITADRDEHIRVSRGIPQAHIIESYCLGHRQFVSCLCIPGTRPELLLSGGGDDEIFLWDWQTGTLRQKLDIKSHCLKYIRENRISLPRAEAQSTTLAPMNAVSQIRHICITVGNRVEDRFAVTCEGSPLLLCLSLGTDSILSLTQVIELNGNALSLTPTTSNDGLIVAVDLIHESGSTQTRGISSVDNFGTLQSLYWEDLKAKVDTGRFHIPDVRSDDYRSMHPPREEATELPTFLYSLESLRKRVSDE